MTPIEQLLALANEFPTRKRINYESMDDRAFCNQVLLAVKAAAPDIQMAKNLLVTTRSPDRVAAPSPSSDAPPRQGMGSSTRTQDPTPNTAGTATSSDPATDSAGTPAVAPSRLDAARKVAAASRRIRSAAASSKPVEPSSGDPLPQSLQSTAETGAA
jgi:hypothetical protein